MKPESMTLPLLLAVQEVPLDHTLERAFALREMAAQLHGQLYHESYAPARCRPPQYHVRSPRQKAKARVAGAWKLATYTMFQEQAVRAAAEMAQPYIDKARAEIEALNAKDPP
jgi:hypothetical protein